MRPNHLTHGFTLVELLIVIVVIVVLAALLFPALFTEHEKGRQITCLSNLKQLTLATRMYAEDWDGILPLWRYDNPGPPVTEPAGIGVIDRDGSGRASYFWMTAVYPYIKNAQAYLCPSAPSQRYTSLPGQSPYGINITGQPLSLHPCTPAAGGSLSGIPRPSDILLLAEGGPFGMDGADNCTEIDNVTNALAPRHNDGLNGGFVDGHAKWLKLSTILANKELYVRP